LYLCRAAVITAYNNKLYSLFTLETRHSLHQLVDALLGNDPSYKQDNSVAIQSRITSCNGSHYRLEQTHIHATGYNADLRRQGPVIANEFLLSLTRGSDDSMAIPDEFFFGMDTQLRFELAYPDSIFDRAKGVEPHDVGQTGPLLQSFTCETRKPVMAVNQIIPKSVLLAEILDIAGEIIDMIIYLQFPYRFLSRLEMDKPCILPYFHDLMVYRFVAARVDVHPVTEFPEFASNFSDVDAHAPRVFFSYPT
jgi:hypothetical protein